MALTAFELCQQGAECFLVPFQSRGRDIWALAPDLVLLPHIRKYLTAEVRQYVDAGIQFGVLDVEGVVWTDMAEYQQTFWTDQSLNDDARCMCTWGPSGAEFFVGSGLFDERQVSVTGCPRFDYYTDPLASVCRDMLKPTFASDRRLVLINTNFTIANTRGHTLERIVDDYVNKYDFDVTPEEVTRWYEVEWEAIRETIRLANDLARDFPELEIILRPHPEEGIEPYTEGATDLPNLTVSRVGSVSPWILSAVAVIQRNCTTAIEANLAGIPALTPEWIPHSHYYPLPESVSVPCPDYGSLKHALVEILDGVFDVPSEVKKNHDSVVESWFYRTDGEAHRRVADAILGSLPDARPDAKKCLKALYRVNGRKRMSKAYLANASRYALGIAPDWSFRKGPSADGGKSHHSFSEADVDSLVSAITAVKAEESPKAVRVASANDGGAYLADSYRGRSIVMTCE